MKRTRLEWLIFLLFFVLAIGYSPYRIARVFICLAVLTCPIDPVCNIIDRILEPYSKRAIFCLVFLVVLGFYPVKDFGILADNIRYVLLWIESIIK